MDKQKKMIAFLPIAVMFLVIGIVFDEPKWLKYIFLLLSIVMFIYIIVYSAKNKK